MNCLTGFHEIVQESVSINLAIMSKGRELCLHYAICITLLLQKKFSDGQ